MGIRVVKNLLRKSLNSVGYDVTRLPQRKQPPKVSSLNKKTFILGVGAQKSGTSWLHKYVNHSATANLGPMKEYHIWDTKYFDVDSGFFEVPISTLHSLDKESLLRYTMLNCDGFYENFFRSLVNEGWDITGDITPAYSMLTSDVLEEIKGRLESVGFKVKVVFLMRDPLERCRSAVRHSKRKGRTHLSENDALREYFRTQEFKVRTMYEISIENIRMTFPDENVFFGIYEELFQAHKLMQFSEFLGIEHQQSYAARKINVTKKEEVIDRRLAREVCEFYKKTYDFCFEEFPQTRELWKYYE